MSDTPPDLAHKIAVRLKGCTTDLRYLTTTQMAMLIRITINHENAEMARLIREKRSLVTTRPEHLHGCGDDDK